MPGVEQAIEDVLLGETIRSVYEAKVAEVVGASSVEGLAEALAELPREEVETARAEAMRFAGRVALRLGELHEGSDRARRIIEDWAVFSRDYDAYDALLGFFDFPGRERVAEEAKRLFPATLTVHW